MSTPAPSATPSRSIPKWAAIALGVTAVSSVVVAGSAVAIAIQHDSTPSTTASSDDSGALLTALQAMAAAQGAGQIPSDATPVVPVPGAAAVPGLPGAAGASTGGKTTVLGGGTAAAGVATGGSAPATAAPAPQTNAPAAQTLSAPTPAELTGVLRNAVDPANPIDHRESYVERGNQARGVLDQISERAGVMLRVVNPQVIAPIDFSGTTASGRLQVTFAGAAGPETPLRLTFVYVDGGWKLSARSVCDVASFQGFSCPVGYA